jgi:CelD/BcsL family acetyltransferase involved in cellulose biosynthesis
VVAGLPVLEVRRPFASRRWICLPFTDVCGPLGSGAAVSDLLEAVAHERLSAGVREIEIRDDVTGGGLSSIPVATRHVLELPTDPNEAFRRFRSSTRQGIRAAERAGVEVETASSRDALTHTFYGLHVATRRRLGVPVQSRRFFELLWDRVLEPGGGSVLIASAGGRAVAAMVVLVSPGTVVYKFGASDAGAWSLRPNHALFWAAIREACTSQDRKFDFGRSDFASEGLRRFKASWGAVERPLVYSTTRAATAGAPGGVEDGPLGRAAAAVIRHSPPIVCRAIGRALYRYAA